MSRRARLTVLELGASRASWATSRPLGADDWVVVAQQNDEAASAFTDRVQKRARRLRKEDAELDSVDLYASPGNDAPSTKARWNVIRELGGQMARGGHLTLWTTLDDSNGDPNFAAFLTQFGHVLAERQITMSQRACSSEPASGVRHLAPAPPMADFDTYSDFERPTLRVIPE